MAKKSEEKPMAETRRDDVLTVPVGEINRPKALSKPETPADPRFTVGSWAGFPQWRCTQCAFDTLEGEADVLQHWLNYHAPAPVTHEESHILVADKNGNEKSK